jgi:copper oxidase (laccase) domain-containing protein
LINEERKNRFVKKFGDLPGMILEKRGKIFLDLLVPLKLQLTDSGVKKKNIEEAKVCTSCQNDEFFSYRKDSQESYGEILGIISLEN